MNVAYIRVSTKEQNTERQYKDLERYDIDKYYEEKVSGKNTDRVELNKMIDFVREGDTVYVVDWSRLSRSVKDLLTLIEVFNSKGVKLVSQKENFDTSTTMGKLIITIIGAIYEFERENLLERQREGIEIAKENGKYKGRKPKEYDSELLKNVMDSLSKDEMTVTEAAKLLSCTRQTIYNILKRENNN